MRRSERPIPLTGSKNAVSWAGVSALGDHVSAAPNPSIVWCLVFGYRATTFGVGFVESDSAPAGVSNRDPQPATSQEATTTARSVRKPRKNAALRIGKPLYHS